jgi:plasmid stability protein
MLQRLTVNLPKHVIEQLQLRAINEGRSLSNLAAFILEAHFSVTGPESSEQAKQE